MTQITQHAGTAQAFLRRVSARDVRAPPSPEIAGSGKTHGIAPPTTLLLWRRARRSCARRKWAARRSGSRWLSGTLIGIAVRSETSVIAT